jgi:lipoprotein LpqH
VVKRGFVVTVTGAAIVAAGLAGCSSNKASNGSSTAATGNGSAKVTIDGKDQTVSGKIACVTTGNQVSIQLGDPSGGLQAVLTTDNPPKVNAVQLGKVSGQVLQYAPGAGDATATRDGNNYKISGHALGGVDMSNPMAGPVSKAFNIDVTCP